MATKRSGSANGKRWLALLIVCAVGALLFIYLGTAFAAEYTGETSTYMTLFGVAAVFVAGVAISGIKLMKARRATK